MPRKKITIISALVLLAIGTVLCICYKKNQSHLVKKPYMTVISPTNRTNETENLSDFFSKRFKVQTLSNYKTKQKAKKSTSPDLTKNNLGKIVVFEDFLSNLEEAPFYLKKATQSNQIRIAHPLLESPALSSEKVLLLNLYFDAVLVPDPFLIDAYVDSGVKIPVFFMPPRLDLEDFLDKPLKTERNPIFLFGNLGAGIDAENHITLIRAFAKIFRNNKNVALHINCKESEEKAKQEIINEITKQNCPNIFFTELHLQKDAYIKFFQSLDCYVSLSKGESLSIKPRQAMALGIPTIVSHNTSKKTLCSSQLVKSAPSEIIEIANQSKNTYLPTNLQFNCEEDDVAACMLELYQNYENHLKNSYEARIWSERNTYSNSNLQKLYMNLASPKRIILGVKNEITADYFMTNSKELYKKYRNLTISQPSPSKEILSSMPTAVINSLKQIELSESHSGLDGIDCIYVINLDERPKRWDWAKKCFDEQKLFPNRVSAINGWNIPLEEQLKMTDSAAPLLSGGALGCLLTHVSIYKDAVKRGFETVWICEDDIEFKEQADKIPGLIKKLTALDPDWDVLYTDYSIKGIGIQNHRPKQPAYKPLNRSVSEEFVAMKGRYNTHSMIFSKKGLAKAYNYFSHIHIWSPIDVDIHYVPTLKEYSVKKDVVTSINDSSVLATDGSSDTQSISSLNSIPR